MSAEVPPLLVSVRNAARMLAVGRTTVYELIATGELETILIGRSRRVPIAALEDFVQRRRGRGRASMASIKRRATARGEIRYDVRLRVGTGS